MAALRPGAVVADRERQEVEHQVRVGDVVVAADEAAGLEVVRRARAAPEEQPLEADPRLAPSASAGCIETGCVPVLDVDLEVVLEVLADAGQVVDDRDAERQQLRRVADARELEELGRVDRAAGEDHLPAEDRSRPAARRVDLDADRPAVLDRIRVTNVRVRTSRFGGP